MLYKVLTLLILGASTSCTFTASTHLAKAANDEDGVGGTGHTKDFRTPETYISGHITAFGSIYVNRAHIKYNSRTLIKVNGITTPNYKLKLGEVVEIRASRNSTFGSYIHVVHEVSGRVSKVNRKTRSFIVLGQTVQIRKHKIKMPRVGQRVAISGYTDNNLVIHASNIIPTNTRHSVLSGYVHIKQGRSYIRNILIAKSPRISKFSNGYLIVTGRYSEHGFHIKQVHRLSDISRFRSIRRVIVRGYVTRMPDGTYTLGKLGVHLSSRQAKKKLGKLVTLEATRNNRGEFNFERFHGKSKSEHPGQDNEREHETPEMKEPPDIERESPDIDRSAGEDRDRERPGP